MSFTSFPIPTLAFEDASSEEKAAIRSTLGVGYNPLSKIVNPFGLKEFLDQFLVYRGAGVGLYDSNGVFNGKGHNYFCAKVFGERYGVFGTGLMALGIEYGSGTYEAGAGRNGVGTDTGANAALDQYAPGAADSSIVPGYAYVASGNNVTPQGFGQYGMFVSPGHGLGISGNLKFRLSYGTFPSGSTTYTPMIRQEASPFSTLANGATINPVTGSYGIIDYTVSLASASRTDTISFEPGPVNSALNGPFYGLYISCENTDKTSGISWQKLVTHAGGGLKAFRDDLTAFGGPGLQEYYRQILLQLTGEVKPVLVLIDSGVNDQNATDPSKAGFQSNLVSLIETNTESFVAAGGDASEIHFLIVVSQPLSLPDDFDLIGYRQAAGELALSRTNVSAVNIEAFRDADYFATEGWYNNADFDRNHLSDEGYEGLWRAIINEIYR